MRLGGIAEQDREVDGDPCQELGHALGLQNPDLVARDADFFQHRADERRDVFRLRAGAARLEPVPGVMPEQRFRDLAARSVRPIEEQDSAELAH
jgi:hypothetical protein